MKVDIDNMPTNSNLEKRPDDLIENKLAALDAAIERCLADADAGRVLDGDTVFDQLEAELAALPAAPSV